MTALAPIGSAKRDVGGEATTRARREAAILDAAETLFQSQGYEGTKLGDIIKHSGGSLQTLYELFGNKQGLLHAIATRWRDETVGRVPRAAEWAGSKIDFLKAHARAYSQAMALPRTIALTRMLVSESLRDKDFAWQIHLDLHVEPSRELANLFARWQASGDAEFGDPAVAAEFFQTLVRGDALAHALSGRDPRRPAVSDLEARIAFFAAYYRIR